MLLGEEAHRTVEPLRFAPGDIERQQRRQRIEQRMVAGLGGFEEAAPHFGLGPVRPACDSVDALLGDPADLARVGRAQAGAARQPMRIVAREDGDASPPPASLAASRRPRPPACPSGRSDSSISLSGTGKNGSKCAGVNCAATQKSPLNSPSTTTPPVRRSDSGCRSGRRSESPCRHTSGVSVNLSGKPVILASDQFA